MARHRGLRPWQVLDELVLGERPPFRQAERDPDTLGMAEHLEHAGGATEVEFRHGHLHRKHIHNNSMYYLFYMDSSMSLTLEKQPLTVGAAVTPIHG